MGNKRAARLSRSLRVAWSFALTAYGFPLPADHLRLRRLRRSRSSRLDRRGFGGRGRRRWRGFALLHGGPAREADLAGPLIDADALNPDHVAHLDDILGA